VKTKKNATTSQDGKDGRPVTPILETPGNDSYGGKKQLTSSRRKESGATIISKPENPGVFKVLLPQEEMISLIEEARYGLDVDDYINSSTTHEKVYESEDAESEESGHSDVDDTDVTDLESTLRVMTRKSSSRKLTA